MRYFAKSCPTPLWSSQRECIRQQFLNDIIGAAGSVADAADLRVAAELRDHLPARAAGRYRLGGGGVERERDDRRRTVGDGAKDRVAFGTGRESERRVLDVATAGDRAVRGEHRCADREAAVLTICVRGRRASSVGQPLPLR